MLDDLGWEAVAGVRQRAHGARLLCDGHDRHRVNVTVPFYVLVGYRFSNRSWYRAGIAIPASILIGATGFYWFLELTTGAIAI